MCFWTGFFCVCSRISCELAPSRTVLWCCLILVSQCAAQYHLISLPTCFELCRTVQGVRCDFRWFVIADRTAKTLVPKALEDYNSRRPCQRGSFSQLTCIWAWSLTHRRSNEHLVWCLMEACVWSIVALIDDVTICTKSYGNSRIVIVGGRYSSVLFHMASTKTGYEIVWYTIDWLHRRLFYRVSLSVGLAAFMRCMKKLVMLSMLFSWAVLHCLRNWRSAEEIGNNCLLNRSLLATSTCSCSTLYQSILR